MVDICEQRAKPAREACRSPLQAGHVDHGVPSLFPLVDLYENTQRRPGPVLPRPFHRARVHLGDVHPLPPLPADDRHLHHQRLQTGLPERLLGLGLQDDGVRVLRKLAEREDVFEQCAERVAARLGDLQQRVDLGQGVGRERQADPARV